jgi:hypothetical protein
MSIKTLDSPNGIVNGLVGIYVAHSEKILLFKTKTGKILPIPKFRQNISLNNRAADYFRLKFPFVNANSVTIHRVQGASLNRVQK